MSMYLIQHVDITSATSIEIALLNIPQNYTDLVLKISARNTSAGIEGSYIKPNNVAVGTNQTEKRIIGDSGSLSSNIRSYISGGGTAGATNTTANTFASTTVTIPSYTTARPKVFSTESSTENMNAAIGTSYQVIYSSVWNDTAPITSLYLISSASNNYAVGTTVSLYGISAGSDGSTTVS